MGKLDDRTISILMRDVMNSSPDDGQLLHLHTVMQLVAAEREACARVAEARAKDGEVGTWQGQEGLIIAADIRARST